MSDPAADERSQYCGSAVTWQVADVVRNESRAAVVDFVATPSRSIPDESVMTVD
jgi:hypothetical protein